MTTTLDNTGELRIGAEYKIEKLSLRAGYRIEQSPYKNKTTVGDLTGYSGGLGYNFGSTKIDLSYAYAKEIRNKDSLHKDLLMERLSMPLQCSSNVIV
jgi:long-subunit fatty acid transport protein